MDYVVGGNVMLDTVRFADGSEHAKESIEDLQLLLIVE